MADEAQVLYIPAYCYRCEQVVFIHRESGSSTPRKDSCPVCGTTDVEKVSPRLANVLQRSVRRSGQ